MKIPADRKLFWFLKEDVELDISQRSTLDMVVQQVLSYGKTEDVRQLLYLLKGQDFVQSFQRVKNFLPVEVKKFWEESLGNINGTSEKNTPSN